MQTAEHRDVADPAAELAKAVDDYLEYLTSGSAIGLSYEGHQAARREKLAAIRRARAAYKSQTGN